MIHPDVQEIILSEELLQERVAEIGAQISRDYEGRTVLLVAVLRGAALFIADLARAITVPVELDFMAVSSYGSSTKSSGVVRILKDLDETIEGKAPHLAIAVGLGDRERPVAKLPLGRD